MPYAQGPWKGDLEPGRKAFCACGETGSPPFCDGSHARKGTGKTPFVVELTEARRYAICQCGRSARRPFCDGSHRALATTPPEAPPVRP
jgi:CDGSH-type Zn-finger protein